MGGRKSKGYTLKYGLWRCSPGSWYLSWLWVLWLPWLWKLWMLCSICCHIGPLVESEYLSAYTSAILQRLLLGCEISQTPCGPAFFTRVPTRSARLIFYLKRKKMKKSWCFPVLKNPPSVRNGVVCSRHLLFIFVFKMGKIK